MKTLRFSVRFRVLSIVLINFLITLAGIVVLTGSIGQIHHSVDNLDGIWFEGAEKLLNADRDAYQSTQALAALAEPVIRADNERRETTEGAVRDNRKQVKDRFDAAAKVISKAMPIEAFKSRFATAFDRWTEEGDAILALFDNGASDAQVAEGRSRLYGSYAEAFDTMREVIDQLTDKITDGEESEFNMVSEIADSSETVRIFLFVVLALTLGAMIAAFTLFVVNPLRRMRLLLRDIASGEGDLTRQLLVKSNDEIGEIAQDFNTFEDAIRDIVHQIHDLGQSLGSTAKNLTARIQETTRAITAISDNTEKVKHQMLTQSSSVTESASTVEQISRNIESLNRMIEDQSANIVESSSSVEEMVHNIYSVTKNLEKASEQFESLISASDRGKEKIRQVNDQIKEVAGQSDSLIETNELISGIASQTNLLAMNAAIEAAHAGEAGKGFSVVADEIRKLAELTSAQSKDIAAKMNSIKTIIDEAVGAAVEAETTFDDVKRQIETASRIQEEAKSSMIEQSEGSNQVLKALEAMNKITGSVKDGSSEMQEGSRMILQEINNLLGITEEIRHGMDSIADRSKDMSGAIKSVETLTQENSKLIDQVLQQGARFKV